MYKVHVALCACLICFVVSTDNFGENELQSVVRIQRRFCTDSRLCGKNQQIHNMTFKTFIPVERRCCERCSCDEENCATLGTCCPDVFDHVPTVSESVKRIKATCERAQYLSSINFGEPMLMIRKCPDRFEVSSVTAAEIKNKCENPVKYNSLEAHVPVTDSDTLITYQNVFCSRCYNVVENNTIFLDVSITCGRPGDESVLHGTDSRNILEALKKSQSCNIVYTQPKQFKSKLPTCKLNLIKECNVTGLWEVYDPVIEAACHSYTSMYDDKYNNVFCALCNKGEMKTVCFKTAGVLVPPPFSALLTFRIAEPETEIFDTACQASQVFDRLTNVCRNLTCRFPKMIDQGKCINSIETVTGLSYRLYIRFKPSLSLPVNDLLEAKRLLDTYTKEILVQWKLSDMVFFYNAYYKRNISLKNMTSYGVETNEYKETNINKTSHQLYHTEAKKVYFSSITKHDNSSKRTASTVHVHAVDQPMNEIDYLLFYIKLYFAPSVGNTYVSVLDEILDLDGKSTFIHSNTSGFSSWFNISLEDYGMNETKPMPLLTDIDDNAPLGTLGVVYDYVIFERTRTERYKIDWSRLASNVLTAKASCPLIQLNERDYLVDRQFHCILIRNINLSFPMKYVFETITDNTYSDFYMCAEIYLQGIEQMAKDSEDRDRDGREITPQGILSLVCICLSVLCNVITLVTFSLFKELRSQPGINNMCLVTCLIVAQCLFQFGHMETDIGEVSCITLGILTHFFWLMVIFWMNVCSYHMFRVFYHKGEARRTYSSKCKITSFYFSYSILMSVIFVAINVAVSTAIDDGVDVGYSIETCYISQPLMVGFVFALPVGIVIVVNITFFVFVIKNVRGQPTLKGVHRNYYKIYAKLSTITGITWIFGIMFFFTGISVIEYLFITFNASQGVFIFLAFVLNRRVMILYKQLFGKKQLTQTNTPASRKTEETLLK